MIERYLVVLEDFMINEKLCILLNINEEFDRPTFINDLFNPFFISPNLEPVPAVGIHI